MRSLKIPILSLDKILALLLVVWAVSPPLQYGTLIRTIVVISAVIWALSVLISIKGTGKVFLLVLFVGIFLITAFMIGYAMGEPILEAITSRLQITIFLLFICIGSYYLQYDRDYLIKLAMVAIILLLAFSIRTFIEYQTTPNVSRLLVKSSDVSRLYARKGVGGYGLIYTTVFSNAALLYLFAQAKGKKRILFLAGAVVGIVIVFFSGYMIANLLTFVAVLSLVIGVYKADNKKAVALVIVLLVIGYIIVLLIEQYSDQVISLFNGTMYKTKVSNIIQYLTTDEVTGKLEGRTTRYIKTITALFNHPVFGAYLTGSVDDVGGHSTLLDIYALYGVFSLCFYISIIKGIKQIKSLVGTNGFLIMTLIMAIMNGVFNTYAGSHGVAFFVVIPGVMAYAKNNADKASVGSKNGNCIYRG